MVTVFVGEGARHDVRDVLGDVHSVVCDALEEPPDVREFDRGLEPDLGAVGVDRSEEPLGDVVDDIVRLFGVDPDLWVEVRDGFDRRCEYLRRLGDEPCEEALYLSELWEAVLGGDSVRDVDREIARSLGFVEDPGSGDQESQIGRNRLLEGQDLERALFEDPVQRR